MGQTLSAIYLHIIFGTAGRNYRLSPQLHANLRRYIGTLLQAKKMGSLVTSGGWKDHLHMLPRIKPAVSVSQLVSTVKANTSRWLKQEFQFMDDFAWQPGYSAYSISPGSVDNVEGYIRTQERHHRKLTYGEEILQMAEKHGIQVDPSLHDVA